MSVHHSPTLPRATAALSERPSVPTLLTIDEVAARLNMSTKSVRRRIKGGVIQTVPLGGRMVRIAAEELRRLTNGLTFQNAGEDADITK